jgi:hypothetical protein
LPPERSGSENGRKFAFERQVRHQHKPRL